MVIVHVIVGQGNVKRVLLGNETGLAKSSPGNWVILAAIVGHPTRVPRTLGVWYQIAFRCLFAHPKNSGDDVVLPGKWRAITPFNSRENVIRDSIFGAEPGGVVMTIRSVENRVS